MCNMWLPNKRAVQNLPEYVFPLLYADTPKGRGRLSDYPTTPKGEIMKKYKKYKVFYFLLSDADAIRLNQLKGDGSWHQFLGRVEASLSYNSVAMAAREDRLIGAGVKERDICQVCFAKHYSNPIALKTTDFVDLVADYTKTMLDAQNISEYDLIMRFVDAKIEPIAGRCPSCGSYDGVLPYNELILRLLPEWRAWTMRSELFEHFQGAAAKNYKK